MHADVPLFASKRTFRLLLSSGPCRARITVSGNRLVESVGGDFSADPHPAWAG